MANGGLMGFLYSIAEWVMRLAYVNILWILFTVMGLIVFGLFPATAGLFTVTRKWIMGDTDVSVWKTFWGAYRKEFVKANINGYLFLIIGWIIFIDLKFFQSQGSLVTLILSYVFLIAFIFYIIMGLFLFPVFVHYDLRVLQYIKQTALIVILRPIDAIFAAAGGVVVYYLMRLIPGLLPFFGMSVLSLVLMWVTYRAFNKLQVKIEKQGQKG